MKMPDHDTILSRLMQVRDRLSTPRPLSPQERHELAQQVSDCFEELSAMSELVGGPNIPRNLHPAKETKQ